LNCARICENHPNIVDLRGIQFDYVENEKKLGMVRLLFNLVKGNDLKSFIKKGPLMKLKLKDRKKPLLDIFSQIVEGIEFIHRFGIIHSDIKHLNILVEELGA
jgi:serine/threonine protein kinase